MNFNFILDENYLALFILNKKIHNESQILSNIKNKLYTENNPGYKKIIGIDLLDTSIYLNKGNIKELIYAFINTNEFKEIYKSYNNESKEAIAIKILKGIINIESNNLENIKNDLWYKYMDDYQTLLNININCYNPQYFPLDKDVINTIEEFKKTEEFKKLYEETKTYYNNLKEYWNINKDKMNNYLKQTLKININTKINVYVSHPNTCEGFSFDNNKIVWGHYNGIKDLNYNLVYLIHEGLHCIIPFETNETEEECYIKHSIIELIADYELYSKLSQKSTIKEGHPYLHKYRMLIYPYWLKYIGLDNNEIKKRLQLDKVNLDNFIDINNNEIKDINIYQFIDYCKTHLINNKNKISKK